MYPFRRHTAHMTHTTGLCLAALSCLLMLFSACTGKGGSDADVLNLKAYQYHYRNLDSTQWYAQQAYRCSDARDDSRAEALNHLAFVQLARMNYAHAQQLLDSVPLITDNCIEKFVADIQLMRLCQRCSENKRFYDYRDRAEQYLHRIREDIETLTPHQRQRFIYAESEYYIVLSTYYYYMGLEQQAADALSHLHSQDALTGDTAQYLAYLYNYGAGGSITQGTAESIAQQEWELLTRCYQTARQHDYPYWQANALQALSEHLLAPTQRDKLLADNRPVVQFINGANIPDSLLAGQLATDALDFFAGYGDVYQMAGAYRTLARCYQQIGDYEHALTLLHAALDADTLILQAPDLVASICEQLSIVNAALNDKAESDRYRNQYLDLIGRTQQDKAQEAIAEQLANSDRQRNVIIAIISGLLLMFLLLSLIIAYRQHRLRRSDQRLSTLRQPIDEWTAQQQAQHMTWQEEQESMEEQLGSEELLLLSHQQKYMEQRAKIAIVNSITPLIDRILVEYQRSKGTLTDEQREYVRELTLKIEDYNSSLTQWIQMQQGSLNMHIESFPLQALFDIVAHNKTSFTLKGITLDIEPTQLWAKGDPTLTLFMVNTIADNARRFTPEGGHIVIAATEQQRSVEVSITDDGQGMTAEQCANLFKLHAPLSTTTNPEGQHHGFGLLNCRGIIEKYRKMSPVFSVCEIGCQSEQGKGSRFHFRLPKGIVRTLSALLLILLPSTMHARQHTPHPHTAMEWADSAYFANVNGHYEEALISTQQALKIINAEYKNRLSAGIDTLLTDGPLAAIPPEVEWLHNNIDAPYDILLDVRNEAAVAALALHEWQTYYYNNRVYTLLYKELTADNMLMKDIKKLQHNVRKKNTIIIVLTILLACLMLAAYLRYYRPRQRRKQWQTLFSDITDWLQRKVPDTEKLRHLQRIDTTPLPAEMRQLTASIEQTLQADIDRQQQYEDSMTLSRDQLKRIDYEKQRLHITNSVLDNCLSTLKHETMYFPTRIRAMLTAGDSQSADAYEMTEYYKTLHTMLATQAQQQTDTTPLPPPRRLTAMLLDIINSLQKEKPQIKIRKAETPHYSEMTVTTDIRLAAGKPLTQLFNFDCTDNHPLLLCRQIVRDIGESTNHRGCGIRAVPLNDTHFNIIITLPTKVLKAVEKADKP